MQNKNFVTINPCKNKKTVKFIGNKATYHGRFFNWHFAEKVDNICQHNWMFCQHSAVKANQRSLFINNLKVCPIILHLIETYIQDSKCRQLLNIIRDLLEFVTSEDEFHQVSLFPPAIFCLVHRHRLGFFRYVNVDAPNRVWDYNKQSSKERLLNKWNVMYRQFTHSFQKNLL